MARKKVQFESFADGLVDLYQLDENENPKKVFGNIHFQRRVIGAKRNYLAQQAGHTIRQLIRIPRLQKLEDYVGTFAVIQGKQYQVAEMQEIIDTIPPTQDLTLEQPEILLTFDESEAGSCGRN